MSPLNENQSVATPPKVARTRTRKSLSEVKERALGKSASNRPPQVDDVRRAYGFLPVDVQGVVVRWRGL